MRITITIDIHPDEAAKLTKKDLTDKNYAIDGEIIKQYTGARLPVRNIDITEIA